MRTLTLIITIFLLSILTTGCTTTGTGDQYVFTQSVPRGEPNVVGGMSGYYNPPNTGYVRGGNHNLSMNANFNGQPVSAVNSRDQQSWVRLAQQQQMLDHREAMDRARQQQAEFREYKRAIQDIAREARRWTRGSGW